MVLGHRVRRGLCIYLALEGQHGIRQRVAAYRRAKGGTFHNVHFILDRFRVLSEDDQDALVDAVLGVGLESPVVFIDTLAQAAAGADENSNADMGRIVSAAMEIQQATKGLVVVIHHAGKDVSRGMRGGSALPAAADASIEVKRGGDDARSWTLAKAKDGRDGITHGLELRVIELGEDEDGDPITSCVIDPDEARGGFEKPKPKEPKLSRDAAACLALLADATHHQSEPWPEEAYGPRPQDAPERIVTNEALRRLFLDTSRPGDSHATKSRAYLRAMEALREINAVGGFRDAIWPNPQTRHTLAHGIITTASLKANSDNSDNADK